MNKSQLFALSIGLLLNFGVSATNIVKTPGSTTDVFSELPIKSSSNADTLFIEGGSEDIFLKAGPSDNGSPYVWSAGNGTETTYTITFKFSQTGNTATSMGYVGQLCSVSRINPVGTQYFWVFYKGIPLKPTTPSGSTSVCAGSNNTYSSTSVNAKTYEWTIDPVEAAIITNGSTSSPTITWSNLFVGQASLQVKGINVAISGVLSDPITITINAVPQKPEIEGDNFVKETASSIYNGISLGANNWTWILNPLTGIAASTPTGSQTSLTFTNTGKLTITLQTQNGCGSSVLSDPFEIDVVDPELIQTLTDQVSTLTASNQDLIDEVKLLTSQNDDLQSQVTDLNLINSDLQTQVNELSINNLDLKAQVDDYTIAVAEMQTQIDELQATNSDLTIQVEILDFLNADLQSKVDELSKTYILKWTVESVTTQIFETTVGKFSVSLYPNPSPGEINIVCTENMKDLSILNLQGQVLKTLTINGTSTKFTVNRSEMPAGTYLIRITTNKGVATHKVIINPK